MSLTYDCPYCSYSGMNLLMHVRSNHPEKEQEFLDSKKPQREEVVLDEGVEQLTIVDERVPQEAAVEGLWKLEVHSWFCMHMVDEQGRQGMEYMRELLANVAAEVLRHTPRGREQTMALGYLRKAMWAANSAIAAPYPVAPSNGNSMRYPEVDGEAT